MRGSRGRRWVASWLVGSLLLGCHQAPFGDSPAFPEPPPLTSEELFQVAQLHVGRGDLLRAEQYFAAALDSGHDPEATTYWLVRVCVAAGKFQSALIHATRRLRAAPTSSRLRLIVASLHEALGNVTQAAAELESLVETDPGHAFAHYRLAMLYREVLADQGRAVWHLRRYLALDPEGAHAAEARFSLERARRSSVEISRPLGAPEAPPRAMGAP